LGGPWGLAPTKKIPPPPGGYIGTGQAYYLSFVARVFNFTTCTLAATVTTIKFTANGLRDTQRMTRITKTYSMTCT